MKTTRRALTGLVAASLLALTATACNSAAPEPAVAGSASPTVAVDPRQALVDSTKVLAEGNFRFTLSSGEAEGGGSVHLPTRSATIKVSFKSAPGADPATVEFVYIGDDSWTKIDFGRQANEALGFSRYAGKYMHLDQGRSAEVDQPDLLKEPDPAGVDDLIQAIATVRATGEGTFAGTIDLTKAPDAMLVEASAEAIEALGASATYTPFEAKVDAEGRLVDFIVKLPPAGRSPVQDLKMSYSDFGAATAAQPPAADQTVPAPEAAYEFLKKA